MESMKDVFITLFGRVKDFGNLKTVNYYDDKFAKIEVEKDGKIYTFSMHCEDKTNGND